MHCFKILKQSLIAIFFVSVSRKPDIEKIFKNVLSQLDKKIDFQAWDKIQLINKIRELLENKRCLCIVDDIWEEKEWDIIKLALPDGNQGSKIITTTRKMAVAEHAGGGVYELKPLSDDHSKMLLNKRIFDSEDGCPSDLTEVTEKILKKCGGVPLAIITIASLLANKPRNLQEWEKVNKSISRGLGNSLTVDKMREILSLSYYDLPPHLKNCLLYVSIYPEDMEIKKDVLVWSWIVEGFISDEEQPTGTTLQEVGEGYFNELINRSLIQAVDIVSIANQDGQVHACQVHDMVLEFINKLSAEEGFVTELLSDGQQAGTSAVQKKIRRLSLHAERTTFASTEARERLSYPHVRSLAAFGKVDSMPPLSGFRVLRVLQLEDCSRLKNNHLKDIGEFHHLRFLRLRRAIFITELPESIGNLQFLETLDIRGIFISVLQLPKSFVNLGNLVRLIADRVKLPHGVTLGNMECLQQLVGICFTEDTMQAIGDLTELRVLKIVLDERKFMKSTSTETLDAYLQRCKNLQDLTISSGYVAFMKGVPSSLQRFKADGQFEELPGWINSSLSCLNTLSIELRSMRQEHLMVLAELPSLRFLRINTGSGHVRLIIHSGAFPSLRDLYSGTFVRFTVQPGAMPNLRRLFLCPRAPRKNNSFGLENLPSLRHVFVDIHESGASEEQIQGVKDEIRKEINDNPNHPSLDFV